MEQIAISIWTSVFVSIELFAFFQRCSAQLGSSYDTSAIMYFTSSGVCLGTEITVNGCGFETINVDVLCFHSVVCIKYLALSGKSCVLSKIYFK